MYIKKMMMGCCALSLSFSVFAVDTAKPATTPVAPGSAIYLALGKVTIDSEAANKENIKDTASYIRLGFEILRNPWLFGGGLSGIFYSDEVGFSQTVVDQFGTVSKAESSADSFNLYGESGYSYSLANFLKVELLAGYELVLSSSRSIANCSNCASQDIEIDAGFYLNPRIRFVIKNNYTLSLSAHKFMVGDLKNVFSLGFGISF